MNELRERSVAAGAPDLSLVLVNWNTRDLLLSCLESIERETVSRTFEIVVVDNGSSDGSAEAVKARFPRVRVIQNGENLGFSRANNIGMRQCEGRYVCLVNTDVLLLDRCLDKMIDYLENHPEVGALGPKTVDQDLRLNENCREFPSLRNLFCQAFFLDRLFPRLAFFRGRLVRGFDYAGIREVEVLSGCVLMVRRAVLDTVGLLDERFFIYGEDTDWCRRIRAEGWKNVFFPEARAIHLKGCSSARDPLRFQLEMLKANYQYWRKHHGPAARRLYLLLRIAQYGLRTVLWTLAVLLGRRGAGSQVRRNSALVYWHLIDRGRFERTGP